MITTFNEDHVREGTNEKVLAIIVPAFGEKPLKVVKECEQAKHVWYRLHERYAGKTVIKRLTALRNLLNTSYTECRSMGDHIMRLESQYAHPAAIQTSLDDSTKVAC